MLLLKVWAGYYHGCMFEISSNFSAYFLKIFLTCWSWHFEILAFQMFEEVMLDISVVSWPPSGFSWTPASVSWNDWLPPVPEFSDLRHTMRNKGKQFGGSKYGVKSVEPFPTNIIKSISYVQLKRNIWCTRYMELLSKTGTALWIGKWGICPPCVPAPPPRFPLDHCSRHLRWVKAVRHRSAEHPGEDHCDDGSDREE